MQKTSLPLSSPFLERPYTRSVEACLNHFKVQKEKGLTAQMVQTHREWYGKNSLPEKKKKWWGRVFFSQFLSPLIALLLVSGAIIWWMGSYTDALVVLGVVILNALMGTIQEGRAERSLAALRKLSSPRTRVLREGLEVTVDATELVPGDIVVLTAGDAVAADMRVIEAASLEVNESALTGETHSVTKTTNAREGENKPLVPLYEQLNMLFAGTHVAKGRCVAVVTATGIQTEVGKIAALAEEDSSVKTPIEVKIAKFGHHLTIAALIIFFAFFGIGFLRDHPLKDIFMAAVSQLVSIIPEGLPVAITIALAVGVQRMAKKGALVRRLHAVETLGSTTVICTDKTGTLTKNEMTVTHLSLCAQPTWSIKGAGYVPQGDFICVDKSINPLEIPTAKMLLEASVLCNDATIREQNGKWVPIGDPMEAALVTMAKKAKLDILHCLEQYPRLAEIPFSSEIKMMATCHQDFSLLKGAFEEVLALCSHVHLHHVKGLVPITEDLRQQIASEAALLAAKGRRILGFARVSQSHRDEITMDNLRGKGEWLGFVALMDPPREEALQAVALCHKAHIRTVMITGDHLTTATAIAAELGILRKDEIAIDGKQLAEFSDAEFMKKVQSIRVYARMQPEQKFKVIAALQKLGEVVAMTGDGVNDAPALAKADVGVAMGSGTEVAKEAAKMVITDDNFATLVQAVEQGRLVYRNILKVVLYLLGTTFAAAFVMVLAISLGYPLPMAAVQILWINVITEGTITINLVLDPPDGTEMHRPPVRKNDAILSFANSMKLLSTIGVIGGILFIYFLYVLRQHHSLTQIQTEVFTLLAFAAWFKMISSRSEVRSAINWDLLRNRYLVIGLFLSIILQAAVLYIPALNHIFHTVPLSAHQVLLLLGIGSIVLWIDELRKWLTLKKH